MPGVDTSYHMYVRIRNLYWYLVRTCFLVRLFRVIINNQNRHQVCLFPGRYLSSSIRVIIYSGKAFCCVYCIAGGGMCCTKHGAQLFNFVHMYIIPSLVLVSHVIFYVNVDLLSSQARILFAPLVPVVTILHCRNDY